MGLTFKNPVSLAREILPCCKYSVKLTPMYENFLACFNATH